MKKELVKKEAAHVASADLSAWGSGPDISTKDLVVPKLLLMQGTSELVKKKKAQYGDLLDSIDREVLGGSDHPFEVIPFHIKKHYTIRNKNTPKKDFVRIDPLTAETDNLPYFDIENGMEIIRERTYELYCVRANAVAIGGLPLVISLKASNEKTGKAIFTQMYIKNRNAGMSPAAVSLEVSSTENVKDDNSYMVFDIKPKRKSTEEEVKACLTWHKMMTQLKVDESDEDTTPEQAMPRQEKNAPSVDLTEEIPF